MIVVRILPTYLHSGGVIADNSGLFHSLIVQDCLNLNHQIRLHYVYACGFMLVAKQASYIEENQPAIAYG